MQWYYHVFIAYRDENNELRTHLSYNCSEKHVRKDFAVPFMKGRKFILGGSFLRPSDINVVFIWKSNKMFSDLILPNGKSPIGKDNLYIAKQFNLRTVKDVYSCLWEFITSPPEEKRETIETPLESLAEKRKVFLVHGRDETQALRLQKYLTKTLKVDAEMFEDFKETSGSNTIIELLEYIKDNVGYAFSIVTPDDLGCLREDIEKCRTKMLIGKKNIKVESVCGILDKFNSRARQNVVFEHGLFIGALGRDRVCCVLQTDTKEKPSDIDGILYVSFGKSVKDTFTEITEKLKKVGLVKT